jgi:ABC-2 type transport system permease protein
MRALRLFAVFARVAALFELQYRASLVVQLAQSVIELATGLVVLALVFSQVTTLNGWSQPELLAVMGVYTLVGGLVSAFIQPNMERLITDVRQGTLDFVLTKPEDGQLLVSVREFQLWKLVDVALGLVILAIALPGLSTMPGPVDIGAFLVALALGTAMIYSFWLLLTTTAFWIVRMDEIVELFSGIYQSGRWPVSIYPDWLRLGLTFLVPIAFAVTVPAEALTGRLTPEALAGAALVAALLLAFTRWLWRHGLRHYSGASA